MSFLRVLYVQRKFVPRAFISLHNTLKSVYLWRQAGRTFCCYHFSKKKTNKNNDSFSLDEDDKLEYAINVLFYYMQHILQRIVFFAETRRLIILNIYLLCKAMIFNGTYRVELDYHKCTNIIKSFWSRFGFSIIIFSTQSVGSSFQNLLNRSYYPTYRWLTKHAVYLYNNIV